MRRALALPVLVAAVLAAGLAAGATDPLLRFVSWGGAYTRSQMLAFVLPWEERTGTRVEVLDYHGGLDEIRSQVRALNVRWDVVDLEVMDAIRACDEGLLVEIEPAELAPAPDGRPAAEDFVEGSLLPCAVGTVIWSTVVAYDETVYAGREAPDSLADFFDLGRFPGRRGLRRTPWVNLEWALLADGVPPGRVYETLATDAGLERAFGVLDRIKPQIVWWREGEEAPRLLERGRVVMTSAYNGRIQAATEQRGEPFRIVWEHQVWTLDLLGITKGTRRLEEAMRFVRFATSPERLAVQSRHIPYGPVRKSAQALVDPKLHAHLPTEPEHFDQALRLDGRWWADHHERIEARFAAWAERPYAVPTYPGR